MSKSSTSSQIMGRLIPCVFLLPIANATAGHIEIRADIRNPTDGFSDLAGDMSLVFDTDAPPAIGDIGQLVFEAIRCDLNTPIENPASLPFSVGEPNALRTAEFITAHLEYFPQSDVYQVTISRMIDAQMVIMSLVVEKPVGDFSANMTSLPDAPEDYNFGGSGLDSVFVNLDIGPENEFAIWSTTSSFGAFSFSARTIEITQSVGCSPADITGDGQLNFFDVSAFLTLLSQGCP